MNSKRLFHLFLAWLALSTPNEQSLLWAQSSNQPRLVEPLQTQAVARLVLQKGLKDIDLSHYPGSLLLHGMAELAVSQNDPKLLKEALDLFAKFKSKEINAQGSFISYGVGGSGAAYLNYLKKTSQLADQVLDGANRMVQYQKRSSEGILTAHWAKDSLDQVFIDIAFAVTPYLLYSGLAFNQPEYVDIAVFETLELFKILADTNGLIHQARGFKAYNSISEDNWSRGNGWGAFALASLVRDLPKNHPRKKEVNRLAKDFFTAILRFQDAEGMWHQEMSDTTSYVETSGTGLLLYGLGIAIEQGVLPKTHLPAFRRGLSGYLSYISPEGSVSHTCIGCLAPGQGTRQDYMNRVWKLNDPHAFGPVVLAFMQAAKMGIKEVKPLRSLGYYVALDSTTPRTYLRHMPEANGNILWENDRIAFRVYGPPVKNRVGSGIDIWTKSVDYPIIDKWYRLNAEGQEYHVDRGEGCDFFHVGFGRGLGGTAIWHEDKPYGSVPFATHSILKNTDEEIAFELVYDPWTVGDFKVIERKVISMLLGTNFFKVESTFETDRPGPLTVAIGISYANQPEILTDAQKGVLSLWESYEPTNGQLGTTVIVNPAKMQGFASHQKEKFVLVNAQPGQPVTYYAGAGWSKNPEFRSKEEWLSYVKEVANLTFMDVKQD